MESMERVLALQGLENHIDPMNGAGADSNISHMCSTQSSGGGNSSCSVQCNSTEELDW